LEDGYYTSAAMLAAQDRDYSKGLQSSMCRHSGLVTHRRVAGRAGETGDVHPGNVSTSWFASPMAILGAMSSIRFIGLGAIAGCDPSGGMWDRTALNVSKDGLKRAHSGGPSRSAASSV
jgi:hypothetical protein